MFIVEKEYYILDYEGLMQRTDVNYKRYKYCIIPNTRLYRYNKINYLIHDKGVFKRTRNSNFIIAKVYIFTDLSEYIKAKLTFDAYYMLNVNTKECKLCVNLVHFEQLCDIMELRYKPKGTLDIVTYKLNDDLAKQITKDKHRRINAIGIKECVMNE